jgi:CRP-like cAMP-binding protein
MRKLLVIDDHDDIRENIAEILSLAGYETYTAPNGKKGVEAAIKYTPDLVICDIMMPELDGFGVLHLLRKNPATENIPLIFLTARTERSDFRKGMEMGADDYITKPFDDIELLNAIEVRLRKYDVLQTKYASDEKGVSELIKDLNSSGLLQMKLDHYETEDLPKKANLYQEGRRPKALYYLKKGKIKAFRVNEDGKEYITNFFAAGDFIGYLPLLESKNYEDTAIVLEEAEVAMIPRDEFLDGVYNDISIATKFIRLIAQNVQEKEERLLSLAYGSLRKRVARALVDIHNKFSKGEDGGAKAAAMLDISREDIAQYVGTATESLIRTLSDFKSEKLIEIKDGKIRITDLSRLNNLLY